MLLCVIYLCMCLSILVFFLSFMLSVALNMTFADRFTKNGCDRFLRKLRPLPFSLSLSCLFMLACTVDAALWKALKISETWLIKAADKTRKQTQLH